MKSENYSRAFKLLEKASQKEEYNNLNILLGDLLDSEFYGYEDQDSFEQRLKYYSKSGSVGRKVCCYLILLNNLNSLESRIEVEKKIASLFSTKETFTINDVYLMREIAMKGGSLNLSNFLKIDFSKIFKEEYSFVESQDHKDIYNDLLMTISVKK